VASRGGLRLYLEAFVGSTYGRVAMATLATIVVWIALTIAGFE
jgi:hypothetical protein